MAQESEHFFEGYRAGGNPRRRWSSPPAKFTAQQKKEWYAGYKEARDDAANISIFEEAMKEAAETATQQRKAKEERIATFAKAIIGIEKARKDLEKDIYKHVGDDADAGEAYLGTGPELLPVENSPVYKPYLDSLRDAKSVVPKKATESQRTPVAEPVSEQPPVQPVAQPTSPPVEQPKVAEPPQAVPFASLIGDSVPQAEHFASVPEAEHFAPTARQHFGVDTRQVAKPPIQSSVQSFIMDDIGKPIASPRSSVAGSAPAFAPAALGENQTPQTSPATTPATPASQPQIAKSSPSVPVETLIGQAGQMPAAPQPSVAQQPSQTPPPHIQHEPVQPIPPAASAPLEITRAPSIMPAATVLGNAGPEAPQSATPSPHAAAPQPTVPPAFAPATPATQPHTSIASPPSSIPAATVLGQSQPPQAPASQPPQIAKSPATIPAAQVLGDAGQQAPQIPQQSSPASPPSSPASAPLPGKAPVAGPKGGWWKDQSGVWQQHVPTVEHAPPIAGPQPSMSNNMLGFGASASGSPGQAPSSGQSPGVGPKQGAGFGNIAGGSGLGSQSATILNSSAGSGGSSGSGNDELLEAIRNLQEAVEGLTEAMKGQGKQSSQQQATPRASGGQQQQQRGPDLISQAASGAPGIEWANGVERWFAARFGRRN